MRKNKAVVAARFKVSFDKDYRQKKRPKFEDVVCEIWEQLDDLGHDLRNAMLVAPEGATPRQVTRALNEIEFKKLEAGRRRLAKKSGLATSKQEL